jgi:uncharacterized membrane protein
MAQVDEEMRPASVASSRRFTTSGELDRMIERANTARPAPKKKAARSSARGSRCELSAASAAEPAYIRLQAFFYLRYEWNFGIAKLIRIGLTVLALLWRALSRRWRSSNHSEQDREREHTAHRRIPPI